MGKTFTRKITPLLMALICVLALCLPLAACGSSSGIVKEGTSSKFEELTDKPFSAKGTLGKKPSISFKTPYTVTNYTYQIVQEGNGKKASDGDQLCLQQIVLNPSTGKEVNSTWKGDAVCSTFLTKKGIQAGFYKLFKGLRVNSTVVLAVSENSSSTTSTASASSYLLALTLTDARKIPQRASGTKVTSLDPTLPKVTLAKNGEPSISGLTTYKKTGKLVSQTLIQGKGKKIKASDTISVQYKGWVLGGKADSPFDSSWSRGTPLSFSLSGGVITGWTKGLTGKTVGSQVLLIIPPSQGYGSTAQGSIPANSTLVFVVDILSA